MKPCLALLCAAALLTATPHAQVNRSQGKTQGSAGRTTEPSKQQKQPVGKTKATTPCGSRVNLARVWETVRKLHDQDGDGRVTKKEYSRGEVRFGNYDLDGDGVLTDADFPEGIHWNGFAPGFARRADRDRDGTVTTEEWKTLLSRLDPNGDGEITMAEMSDMAPPHVTGKPSLVRLSFDQDLDGVLEVEDFMSMFRDLDRNGDGTLDKRELRRRTNPWPRGRGPRLQPGDPAPDFDLPLADDTKRTVRLSSFRGKRPVALIFGSYT